MKTDKSGKITCAICNKWHGHVIVKHLKEAHPGVSVFDYLTDYDAPIASALGHQRLVEHEKAMPLARERADFLVSDTFGLAPETNEQANPMRKFVNKRVSGFKEAHPLTPKIDPDYVFPEQALRRVLIAFALPERNRVWLHGYAGTGKTQLVTQCCARLNYGLLRINGDTAISRRQLVGDWVVRGSDMVFQYGILVKAMREGLTILIDEIDHFAPPTLAILRGVLEDPSQLVILENGGEAVRAHPDFRVFATANTVGAGDESGLFVTSRALSLADRQRFSIWVNVTYLPPAMECKMIQQRFAHRAKQGKSPLSDNEVRRFYQVVKAIRKRHAEGAMEESFSPREFVNWVEKYYLFGDAQEAAQACFIERYASPSTQTAVAELVRAAFNPKSTPEDL